MHAEPLAHSQITDQLEGPEDMNVKGKMVR